MKQHQPRTALTRIRALLITMGLVLVGIVGVAGTASATVGTNDYPSSLATAAQDSVVDPWGFYNRECTSFVAWRLNNDNGMAFSNNMNGGHFGNAYQWKQNAVNLFGASVYNGTPAAGSVAWWDSNHGYAGATGHVAYVDSVNPDGSINIEEYNYGGTGAYHTRTIATNGDWPSGFLHLKDLARSASSGGWNGVGNATYLGSDRLTTGQQMDGNQYIMSSDGRFVLMMQTDGNLVEYTSLGALWNSGTNNNPGARLVVQSDGNLVIYSANNVALWNTGAVGITALVVQNDAHVVGYADGAQARWYSSYTTSTSGLNSRGTDTLYAGQTMVREQYLVSADGRYHALMQDDGNLVVYAPGYRVVWNSGTGNNPGAYLAVQSDGNMVIYSANNVALWNTTPRGIARVAMQSDGNFVTYDANNVAQWYSNTAGHL